MAALGALEILGQIQVLVTVKLQVISYKWLSRNFSVPSEEAKRLLQEFIDKHEDNVEVIYSLSGWLKNKSENYRIRLASKQKLKEAMKEFDGSCLVEVYSIQNCIPKDLAVLWNAEFVQAEELFNQQSTAENCLRNNRFGSISNPFVKRDVNSQLATATSQPKDNVGFVQSRALNIMDDEPLQPQQLQLGTKEALKSSSTVGSVCKSDQTVDDYATKSHPIKESTNSFQADRKGASKEKNSSRTGGSLATLWNRASVKLKPSSMALDSASNIPNAAYAADAQMYAGEADAVSSDDEGYVISYKRGPSGPGTRKRQFIMNYSDEDDEDDNVVSLASPVRPNKNLFVDPFGNVNNLNMEKEIFFTDDLKKEILAYKHDNSEEKNNGALPEKISSDEASLVMTENNLLSELLNQKVMDHPPMTSKRKKVVKTRIDERGREVMEVVWEEPICSKDAGKDNAIDSGNRPTTTANKEQATGSNALANAVVKGGTKKPGKVGGKDVKQGNILSFFKKA